MQVSGKRQVRRWEGADQTRESLLAAGRDLFAERGYDGAKVEAIAEKAGVNKAMINYHFQGKEGLYRAILLATFEPVVERLKALRGSNRPADEQIGEFVDLFAEMVARRPNMPAMILREVVSGGRHLDDQILPHFLFVFDTVREIVVKGIQQGRFRHVDPLLTHLSLIGTLVFFFATEPMRRRLLTERKMPVAPPSPEAFVRYVKEMLERGLAGGRDPASVANQGDI